MITGDAPLTACHVAARTHIVTRPPLILSPLLHGADTLPPHRTVSDTNS